MTPFTASLYRYTRRKTVEVGFGAIKLGGLNPIRVESMTTTDTMNTVATVEQCKALYDAGCEIIRITAPSMKEAENLGVIAAELRKMGIPTPLVADIHFTPNAAMKAAEWVENVRVNPGNYADRKKFAVREYTDHEYDAELERIYEEFKPLVLKCKEYGRSIRIGTNHGSLSDRIMNRYGDTPLGMVESALEFARICEDCGYYDFLFSMKSSNPLVMIEAYRLLVARADNELAHRYPLHLGVTEAGNSEEGRVKSAIGIGALLEDGLGDTIRVSLTEDPVNEVHVGFAIVKKYNDRLYLTYDNQLTVVTDLLRQDAPFGSDPLHQDIPFNPYEFSRRESSALTLPQLTIGSDAPPRVELTMKTPTAETKSLCDEILFSAKPFLTDGAKTELITLPFPSQHDLKLIQTALSNKFVDIPLSIQTDDIEYAAALVHRVSKIVFKISENASFRLNELETLKGSAAVEFSYTFDSATPEGAALLLTAIAKKCREVGLDKVCFSFLTKEMIYPYRRLVWHFKKEGLRYPIVLRYSARNSMPSACPVPDSTLDLNTLITTSIQFGTLLSDGIGDVLALESDALRGDELNLLYNILQATRYRMTKTEYISCPSCGRTLFDLEEVTAKIKSRTVHLKGVKIGIMGCIVNGPGEMADADFGYVGTGVGQISLYVGKEVVEKNIPEEDAVDRLIDLIKSHGKWHEPESEPTPEYTQ